MSIVTLVCTLSHIYFSSKQVTKQARKHNELLHADFVARMAALVHDPVMLMFADESLVDK